MSAASASRSTNDQANSGGIGLPLAGIALAVILIVAGVVLAGRRDEPLPTVYGRRRGSEAGRSVNGTAVLADLFRRHGHQITTVTRLSPRLDKFDTIVWVPDDFAPPDEAHRDRLEQWLKDGYGRTVIYVGRDYNAAIDYWNRMAPTAPPETASEALHRQAEARAAWEAERSQMPEFEYARWFTAVRDKKPRKCDSLAGPMADGIDAAKTDIHLEGRLRIPEKADLGKSDKPALCKDYESLLSSGDDTLVFRVTNQTDDEHSWNDGQIIVVANGSFVLNYPLVNHEHRKLADKLIAECGDDEQKVAFVESDAKGHEISDKERTGRLPSPFELLKVWPLNAILLHVAVLGMIVCLSRSMIFGRPRDLPGDSPSDFGKHVAALGKLLAATKDRNYAQSRLAQYRQFAERRSGRSHLKNK